ncbi:hypothetical protein AgCh_027787 [Apium graveolens]
MFLADLHSANKEGIYYFYSKASVEQSKLWYKNLSHLNYKAINILVKKELVRDIPNLEFAQNEVYEACQKGKMKKSSHKSKTMNSISAPLQLIHMDLFGPGIVQEFSASRTPQQNGVVERKNRTLVEDARTMLQDAKLPIRFWKEAVNTVCYTQNRYLINKNLGKSANSILSKRKPTLKHLHVFGSKCYILKDNSEYVGKIDSKVFEAIFLGYLFERTAYKIDSEDETEFNTSNIMDEESTEQVNHENGRSSQTPEFDSTNSGEKEEKVLQFMPIMKKMQKIQVNKLTPGNGIGVTQEKQLLVIQIPD